MKSTAVQRTLSLFTGKTDIEDRDARDGTRSFHREDGTQRKRKLTWIGGVGQWQTNDKEHFIEKCSDGYRVWSKGRDLGVFQTIIAAGRACEDADTRPL